ncbi:MAG: glycerol transporter [Peltula sp. TS41687]|nr:MAG: glycerol transporter [Peltula sp. TS41687]
MLWSHYLRRLYSLDTLDTRFTAESNRSISSSKSATAIDSAPHASRRQVVDRHGSQGPRWRTPEFMLYYFVFVTVVPMMFKAAYDVSKGESARVLGPWPRRTDDHVCRNALLNLTCQKHILTTQDMLIFCRLAGSRAVRLYNSFSSTAPVDAARKALSSPDGRPSPAESDARFEKRMSFDITFCILFLCALHGFSALKIGLILYLNFLIAKRVPHDFVPVATWTFNILILFANEYCQGYSFLRMTELLLPWTAARFDTAQKAGVIESLARWLDSYGGLDPRWEIHFNITVLRLIGFNLDYYWSNTGTEVNLLEFEHKKKQLDPATLSERDRIAIPARSQDFSFRNYIAYALYPPLYVAGPILTFNDYIAQLRYPSPSVTPLRTLLYGVRWLLSLLCMELMLHYIYVVAISKSQPAWELYTPFQLSMLGYFNLHIIWLKLLLPWRFFRLWALIDGIDPPENVVRCMSDNYSTLAFWRGWHRSFNRWIIRYIYIPLGGSGGAGGRGQLSKARTIANYLLVFTFVAFWHDINPRLLIWGWLITLFILPEVVAGLLFPRRKWTHHPEAYRILCSFGAVGNILMMMVANLVGFAVGLDGLKGLVQGIVGSPSGGLTSTHVPVGG